MLLQLKRQETIGNTLCGRLYVDGQSYCDTIENSVKAIPSGFYPVRITHSPHWGEILPLIDRVIGRTGIRIHPGNTAEDSEGCILVGEYDSLLTRLLSSRKTFNALRETLLAIQRRREEIWMEVTPLDPPSVRGREDKNHKKPQKINMQFRC